MHLIHRILLSPISHQNLVCMAEEIAPLRQIDPICNIYYPGAHIMHDETTGKIMVVVGFSFFGLDGIRRCRLFGLAHILIKKVTEE